MTVRPWASNQYKNSRPSSTVLWPRVCEDGLMRLSQIPSAGATSGSTTPPSRYTRSISKPSASSASTRGGFQSGFSNRMWMTGRDMGDLESRMQKRENRFGGPRRFR